MRLALLLILLLATRAPASAERLPALPSGGALSGDVPPAAPPRPATFPCADARCTSAQYCVEENGGNHDGVTYGSCQPLPAQCLAKPTCGCICGGVVCDC